MKVDLASFCCSKDRDKLEPVFNNHVDSHGYNFDNVHLVYQRCNPKEKPPVNIIQISEYDYDEILIENGINPFNDQADELTHGWDAAHYWRHHCVNHLAALNTSTADYIVLADADCYIKDQRSSWVNEGIKILQNNKYVLVVSPSDGTPGSHQTQNMSQQVMLVERKRLLDIDFDLPFEGFKEGGPMQEYYFMLEGRIGRYMEKHNLWRYMLSSHFRYWHSQW